MARCQVGYFALLARGAPAYFGAKETPSLSYILGSPNKAWTGTMPFNFGTTRDLAYKTGTAGPGASGRAGQEVMQWMYASGPNV